MFDDHLSVDEIRNDERKLRKVVLNDRTDFLFYHRNHHQDCRAIGTRIFKVQLEKIIRNVCIDSLGRFATCDHNRAVSHIVCRDDNIKPFLCVANSCDTIFVDRQLVTLLIRIDYLNVAAANRVPDRIDERIDLDCE